MAVLFKYCIVPAVLLLVACGEGTSQQTNTASETKTETLPAPAVVSTDPVPVPPVSLGSIAPAESTNKLFRATVTSALEPVVINQIHNWTLHLQTADSALVTDATITVTGSMPAHAHGMPTNPQVTQNLGNGDYLVEGIQFQMGGYWAVKLNITSANQTDDMVFGITLQ